MKATRRAHEGPTHHRVLELWSYVFPLSQPEKVRLIADLERIPPLLKQARGNLTGNARDLWVAGLKNIRDQRKDLDGIANSLESGGEDVKQALDAAQEATSQFADWLEAEVPSKSGPVGHRHRGLRLASQKRALRAPELGGRGRDTGARARPCLGVAATRGAAQSGRAAPGLDRKRGRVRPPGERGGDELHTLVGRAGTSCRCPTTTTKRFASAGGQFVPREARNFFMTAVHFEPTTLFTHFYHYFDLARMNKEPHESPIRRGPLLYNIWDSRAEGMATGVEEMMMLSGLYDDNPHAREIVYVLLAQRAARGLGSLYAHANQYTMKEAAEFHVEWTPRGWMRKDLDLLAFEQQLYLRQPGYGTSYIIGKYLIERLLAERSKQVGGVDFRLYDFYDEVNKAGVIPVSLIRWQLTGKDDEIRALCPECFADR